MNPQKVEFRRLLPLLLERENRKIVGDCPKQAQVFIRRNEQESHSETKRNTSLSFSL